MSPLFHLIFCTPTKFNVYFDNFLATVISEPDLYRFRTFHVPNLISLFCYLCRARVSDQVRGLTCKQFVTWCIFTVNSCLHLAQHATWRTTPCRLSATAYSMYSQLPSILEAVPPSATRGRAMPWWQGHTYHFKVFIVHYRIQFQR